MQILQDLSQTSPEKPSVVTLGAFDGVHLGHERLIRSTVESAQRQGFRSVLVTFFPHPRVVLGRAEPFYLTSNAERFARMEQLGLDCVVVCNFTLDMANLSAAQFVARLVRNLNPRELHIGYDFALGRYREGDATSLRAIGVEQGFTVHVTEPVRLNDLPISSSRIRAALKAGDLRQANACLGRPFRLSGRILSTWHDHARGDSVAMLAPEQEHAIPSAGAFTCRARLEGTPTLYRAVVETSPSSGFDKDAPALLVHLCDFEGEIHKHSMTLDLLQGEPLEYQSSIPAAVTHRPFGARSSPVLAARASAKG